MQTSMLGNSETLRQIWDGPLKDLVLKLNGEGGPEILEELKKFNRREPCWTPPTELLTPITTIHCPAVRKFTATDYFKPGEIVEGVQVYSLGDNFSKLFLPKIEKGVETVTVKVQQLTRNSRDDDIRAAIGKANEEIRLAHFWQVLKARGKVGKWLIAYITGTDGKLWAVCADWCGVGWSLGAGSVGRPDPWRAGDQVCSR